MLAVTKSREEVEVIVQTGKQCLFLGISHPSLKKCRQTYSTALVYIEAVIWKLIIKGLVLDPTDQHRLPESQKRKSFH